MARSLSNAKVISAIVVDGFSLAIHRRGYAAASGAVSSVARGQKSGVVVKKLGEEMKGRASETSPWVPDPVTGYYRPENEAKQIDVAELRQTLLKHKN
ncbi:hypothetical protein VitviT2T_009523 [Vitis vinifera]|uniref:Indole-3-acetic acid-induced protein ARG2 n=2 Tax=Vitis vinifera TaxID=29760 RepID=D7U2B1_VITVI|eukprot:XP_002270639.1 PREDICTED: indole-3-acetic acid-induced protein ARG2 [Vitis vinifera]